MTDSEVHLIQMINTLEMRIAILESEVARLSLFNTLTQETKKLKLDASKFPITAKTSNAKP